MTSVKDFLDTISKPAPELPDVEDSENVDDAWVRRSHKPSLNAASNEAEVGRRRLYVATEDGESKYAGKVISSEAVFGDNQLSGLAGPTEMPSDGSEAGDAESRDEDSDEEGSEEGDSEGSGDVEMDGGTSEDDLSIQQDDGGGHGGAEEAGEDETDREVIKVEGAIAAVNLESQKKKG
ncbi:hypothetical protein Tcan_14909 [Toxocara canis]|uniref:Uncharacterized protein n=1 Tax=Toxocara canis TaxID=6265 RepID=A0A0B2V7S1_TOXCA|nr:hypothetical protein Tcan_14909 [Toxocara canis]